MIYYIWICVVLLWLWVHCNDYFLCLCFISWRLLSLLWLGRLLASFGFDWGLVLWVDCFDFRAVTLWMLDCCYWCWCRLIVEGVFFFDVVLWFYAAYDLCISNYFVLVDYNFVDLLLRFNWLPYWFWWVWVVLIGCLVYLWVLLFADCCLCLRCEFVGF